MASKMVAKCVPLTASLSMLMIHCYTI